MELRNNPVPPHDGRRLPKFLSKIVKFTEFTALWTPFLGLFPIKLPSLFLLIAAAPPHQYYP